VSARRKLYRFNAQGGPSTLHQRTQRSVIHTDEQRNTEHALRADEAYFKAGTSIDGGDQRDEPPGWKIDMANSFSLLTQPLSERQFHRLAMCQQTSTLQDR
jgi:hypothetical protein